jgi:hypothetical protein
MKKLVVITYILFSICAYASETKELQDGTIIEINDGKATITGKDGKASVIPDGNLMLNDGSILQIENGIVSEYNKN